MTRRPCPPTPGRRPVLFARAQVGDPFVELTISRQRRRGSARRRTHHPRWEELFEFVVHDVPDECDGEVRADAPKHESPPPKPWTLNPGPWTLNPKRAQTNLTGPNPIPDPRSPIPWTRPPNRQGSSRGLGLARAAPRRRARHGQGGAGGRARRRGERQARPETVAPFTKNDEPSTVPRNHQP